MDTKTFETITAEEFARLPRRFADRLQNVALLVEEEPSDSTRAEERLTSSQTLLGLYRGVPLNARGEGYGVGGTMPDTITLYRIPLLREAARLQEQTVDLAYVDAVHQAVRETLWHEIGHAFGLAEEAVEAREAEGTNHYPEDTSK